MEKKIEIAVLLTVYNRKEYTLRCLEQIYKQKDVENVFIDAFLVDDASTDGTVSSVRDLYPHVRIIHGTGALFWNRGMRLAWLSAVKTKVYDYFLWLNNDVELYTFAISVLLETAISNEGCIVVGTTCATGVDSVVTYGGRTQTGLLIYPDKVQKQYCDYFNGNIVLIPKRVYEIIGVNDNSYTHSFGDFDYGIRASKQGIKSIVASEILGTCDRNGEKPNWCNPKKKLWERIKYFHSPLGYPPIESFYFEKRKNGFVIAVFHVITSYFRMFFPNLWSWLRMNFKR